MDECSDSKIIFPIDIRIEHWQVSHHRVVDLAGFQTLLQRYKGFAIGHADSDDHGWFIMGNFDLHRIQLQGRGSMEPVLTFLRNHLHHWNLCTSTSSRAAKSDSLGTLPKAMTWPALQTGFSL